MRKEQEEQKNSVERCGRRDGNGWQMGGQPRQTANCLYMLIDAVAWPPLIRS